MTTSRRQLIPARSQACTRWVLTAFAGGMALASTPAWAQQGSRSREVSYTKDILPIFQKRCTICHGVDPKGEFRLDSHENLMAGGKTGAVIVPGDPTKSRLVALIEGLQQPKMPPTGGSLSDGDQFKIRQWILQGAKDDTDADAPVAAKKPLSVLSPRDGAVVRENVRVVIPRASVPEDGFVALYIDNKFRVALAPTEGTAKKPATSPVTYLWDTKAPLTLDNTVVEDQRLVKDGPHVIEVRSYRSDGSEAERVKTQVILQNQIDAPSNRPINLSYAVRPGSVGKTWQLEHVVDVDANPGDLAPRRVGQPVSAGKLTHVETTQNLISLESVTAATGAGFWRERRESPIVVVVNGLKQIVRLETSSRYYSLTRTGAAIVSRQMEREQRDPLINPIDLPGRPMRLNETFGTNLRINLGAYIPGSLNIRNAEAKLDGMEWQFGEQCVRIKANFLGGQARVNIRTWNFEDVPFDIQRGESTFWYSPTSNRVVKATHEVEGSIEVPNNVGGGGMMAGGMGGEFAPGGQMGGMMPGGQMSGMSMPPGGMMPGGQMSGMSMPPGGMMPGGQMGGMAPGGQMGGNDAADRMAMMGGGGRGGRRPNRGGAGTMPGMSGGMMPGGQMGGGMYSGMMGGGMPGVGGGMMPGGGSLSTPAPVVERTRNFHVILKVDTKLSRKTASK